MIIRVKCDYTFLVRIREKPSFAMGENLKNGKEKIKVDLVISFKI